MDQGGTVQVRFQPRLGLLLAAASENVVSIFEVETDRLTHSFKVEMQLSHQGNLQNTILQHAFHLKVPYKQYNLLILRDTPLRYTLCVGTQMENFWHLSVKILSECGHWPQESAFTSLVPVGTSFILVFFIQAILPSWSLEGTR